MNKCCLVGRLTRDPRITQSSGDRTRAQFTLAVDGIRSKDDMQTDFIPVTAWQKTAEIIGKHTHKGDRIGVCGRLRTWSHEVDGQTRYEMEVVAESIDLLGSKAQNTSKASSNQPNTYARGNDSESEDEETLPF